MNRSGFMAMIEMRRNALRLLRPTSLIGGGYEYSPGTGGAVLFGFGIGVEVSPGTVGSGPITQTGLGW